MFKDWQEWHEYMTHEGAVTTVEDPRFLLDGGCPYCGCKSWQITSDGWAYCNGCGYGQCQMFDTSERGFVYDICPDHPYGCPEDSFRECRNKWKLNKVNPKHVMAITYQPKEQPVQDGTCRQTIRVGTKVRVGDEILFHGWSGRPYRSSWSWRKMVTVTDVSAVSFSRHGIWFGDEWRSWDSSISDDLAGADGIVPATGVTLRDVVCPTNAEKYKGIHQVIRW